MYHRAATCTGMTAAAFCAADTSSCAKNLLALLLDAAVPASIFIALISLMISSISLICLLGLMILVLSADRGNPKDHRPHFA